MSQTVYRFLEPVDVLFFRGNKLFGDPGSFGESMVLPWPSVAAGSLRSRMLVDANIDLNRFAQGQIEHAELGTPDRPGTFRVTAFHVARRSAAGEAEILVAPPADLMIHEENGKLSARILRPVPLDRGGGKLRSSYPLAASPVLAEPVRSKPKRGYWLTQTGLLKYLEGIEPNEPEDFARSEDLWKFDVRVGVGLNRLTRSVQEGRLFSNRALAPHRDCGFLVGVRGVVDAKVPSSGTVRLGGDGRAAVIRKVEHLAFPEANYQDIARSGRCRLVLASVGIFERGWLPTGISEVNGEYRFKLHDVRGRLVAAAVPRAEVISGWDLAREQPKSAQRGAPTGSVYWLDELEATAESLKRLLDEGLWKDPCEDPLRRAEGFNRLWLAYWP